jgi:uncharacterized protein YggE
MNATTPPQAPTPTSNPALQLSLSWRTLALLLLVVVAVIIYLWKPWTKPAATRTITVQGEATITAIPDKYQFQAIFENADLKLVTATGNEAIAQLKKLGVKDSDIKTSISSSASSGIMKPDQANESLIYPRPTASNPTYSITATVHDKALAQKVSDYLATTPATGEVTPTASFEKATATKLDLNARAKASDDAKSKAAVTAKQLGAKVGKVIKISDDGYGGIYPTDSAQGTSMSSKSVAAPAGPTVQPGTNEVNYSFTVEFELK